MNQEATWSLFHEWPWSFTQKPRKRPLDRLDKENRGFKGKIAKQEATSSPNKEFKSPKSVTTQAVNNSCQSSSPETLTPPNLPVYIKAPSSKKGQFQQGSMLGSNEGTSTGPQVIKQEEKFDDEAQDLSSREQLSGRPVSKFKRNSKNSPLITTIPISGKKDFIASVLATASEESRYPIKSEDGNYPPGSAESPTEDKVIQLTGDHTYFEFQSPKKKVILKITKNPEKPTEKIKSLDELIRLLDEENLLSGDARVMLEAFMDLPNGLTRNKISNSSSAFRTQMKYTAAVENFASTLYFYSPRAYDFASKIFLLPEEYILRERVKSWNFFPGFSKEALSVLKEGFSNSSSVSKLCSIMIMNVKIKEQCELVGGSRQLIGHVDFGGDSGQPIGYVDFGGDSGQPIGHVDFGGGQNPLDSDGVPLATSALLFVAVGLASDWKLPFGYFPNNGLSTEFLKTLLTEAVIVLDECGLDVRAVISDACGSSLSLASALGCRIKVKAFRDIETGFHHPTKDDRKIQLIYDVGYGLRLLQNILADKGSLQSTTYGKIEWKFLSLLLDISESDFNYEGATSYDLQEFYEEKMKIKIGCHSIGNSLGKTLEMAENLALTEFQGFSSTANFAADIDRAFDTLNSRNPVSPGERSPMYQYTVEEQKESLMFVARRIMGLELVTNKRVVDEGRRMSVITFASTLKAVCQLASDLVNRNIVKYLCTNRLNLQHAEMIMSSLQRIGGWDGLPSAADFRTAFQKLVGRADTIMKFNMTYSNDFEGQDLTIGQGIISPCRRDSYGQLSNFNFISCQSNFLDLEFERLSEARFIAEHIAKKLSCSECIDVLLGDGYGNIFMNSLSRRIHLHPSEYVLKVLRISERNLKVHKLYSWPSEIEHLVILVFQEYSQLYEDLGIKENLVTHYLEEPYHVICLTKVIIRTILSLKHKQLHKFI